MDDKFSSGIPGQSGTEANDTREHVFNDVNLLYCIAKALTPRGRIRLSTLNRACARAVDLPGFWSVIDWTIVGDNDPNLRRTITYQEAARYGNLLGALLRRYGRHVARLHLAHCFWLRVTGLEDLARCVNLVHLDMTECGYYSVDLLGHLVRHCPGLRSLVARGCYSICEPAKIQELFDRPAQQRLNLEHLDLQGVFFPQDTSSPGSDLATVVGRLAGPGLRSLRLGWMGEARAAERCRSPPYMGRLAPLVQQLDRWGDTLTLLDVAGCLSLAPLPGLASAFSCLRVLRVLCLANTHLEMDQMEEGGPGGEGALWAGVEARHGGLGAALRACPTTQLTYLNLRAVSAVHDDQLLPLLARNPRLTTLDLSSCNSPTDAVLAALPASTPNLTQLDVGYVQRMTAAAVRAAALSLPRLTSLGISGFPGLLDEDIAAIAARLTGLTTIAIGGNPRLTDASFFALSATCPYLHSLHAASLPNITSEGLRTLFPDKETDPRQSPAPNMGMPLLRSSPPKPAPPSSPPSAPSIQGQAPPSTSAATPGLSQPASASGVTAPVRGLIRCRRRVYVETCRQLPGAELMRLRRQYPYEYDWDLLPYDVVCGENPFLAPREVTAAAGDAWV